MVRQLVIRLNQVEVPRFAFSPPQQRGRSPAPSEQARGGALWPPSTPGFSESGAHSPRRWRWEKCEASCHPLDRTCRTVANQDPPKRDRRPRKPPYCGRHVI
jgi:hypothetical protein